MKKGQIVEGICTRVDFPAKGLVETGEGSFRVKNVLPGQKVRCRIHKIKHGQAEGTLLEVLEQSPLEKGEICSHFGECGGCTYLSLPYEEQLSIKEAQMKRLFLSAIENGTKWEGIHPSPVIYEYRNKMEFSFGDEYKDGPLALGMHRRGSFYDLVNVEDCKIVDEDYRKILKNTLDFFRKSGLSYFHKGSHEGYLRHLLVRKASHTGEILVALVTTSQYPEAGTASNIVPGTEQTMLEAYREALLSIPGMKGSFAGILHLVNDSVADVVKADRTELLYGKDYFEEELLGLKFRVSVFSFFQTNSHSAEVLYSVVREYVVEAGGSGFEGDGGGSAARHRYAQVYDLYSGTGTITQLLSKVADRCVGVEIVEEAVEAARENAAANGIQNCEFIAGDVLKVLDDLKERQMPPDMIVLDPPRDGIHPKALPKILDCGVRDIIYVSCKPTSLVRDLQVMEAAGYRMRRACCVDQFPWTSGVEVVASFRKAEGQA